MSLRAIEIDLDIHKAIEAERRSFDEAPYLALRRLLGLSDREPEPEKLGSNCNETPLPAGVAWFEDGVEIPHGSHARMRYDYNRQVYEGRFLNGLLMVNGTPFDSLSKAANQLARTKAGTKTQLNGWKYWEARRPGDQDWVRLEDLREQARKELLSKIEFKL